jgi:hypothetical protein
VLGAWLMQVAVLLLDETVKFINSSIGIVTNSFILQESAFTDAQTHNPTPIANFLSFISKLTKKIVKTL